MGLNKFDSYVPASNLNNRRSYQNTYTPNETNDEKIKKMMPRCSVQSSDVQLFQTINGLQQLAQTHRFKGLGLQVVENVQDADFILAHGTDALGNPSGDAISMKLEELENILKQCAAKDIPMVVTNPDFVTVEARALRVMPVGDSLHHDIKGANAAAIQSVLITGGIHATELGLGSFADVADLSSVQALASKCDAYPSYVLPAFTW